MKSFLKKSLGVVMATCLCMNTGITIKAQEVQVPEVQAPEKTAEQILQEATDAAYQMPVTTNDIKNWPQGPSIYGESAIVMDINSGAILYGKNIDEKHFPASITKVMTTLVALEQSQMTDKVVFNQDCISFLEYGDAHIGMKPGEEITMSDALYAVLLASANEVSYGVAANAGGLGYDKFIETMNTRAKELGARNTNFTNANGLHQDNHYTTARDMALMASEAFHHEEFQTITQTLQHVIPSTNLVPETRTFQQNHKMLFPKHTYYYEFCKGGKTGFTNEALTTLVTFADNGDMQLVAVNMKTHGANVYPDTRNMFDYVYNNFHKVSIKDLETRKEIAAFSEDEPYVVLPEAVEFEDLTSEIVEVGEVKEKKGTVTYTYDGQVVGTVSVSLSPEYYKAKNKATTKETEKVKEKVKTEKSMPSWAKVLLSVLAVGAVLFFVYFYFAYVRYKRRKATKQRRRREREARRR